MFTVKNSPMAPKSFSQAAKQSLILSHLRSTNTVHTLKELEKSLPSVASINSMQVKDFLQALSDEDQIRVEKIGSGNWYWSFMSTEKKAKEVVLESLGKDKHSMENAMAELRQKIEEAKEGVDEGGSAEERNELRDRYVSGKEEVEKLRKELEGYSDCDPRAVYRKKQEVEAFKAKATIWTDNIYCLESYLREATGGDREALERVREEFYETEYVAGEGLREF